jgi:hypothetical protein
MMRDLYEAQSRDELYDTMHAFYGLG